MNAGERFVSTRPFVKDVSPTEIALGFIQRGFSSWWQPLSWESLCVAVAVSEAGSALSVSTKRHFPCENAHVH